MAMNIFPPSTTVHAGDVVQLPFYCSEPGTVTMTSSDETVATVAGSVVIPEAGPYIPALNRYKTVDETLDTKLIDATMTTLGTAFHPNGPDYFNYKIVGDKKRFTLAYRQKFTRYVAGQGTFIGNMATSGYTQAQYAQFSASPGSTRMAIGYRNIFNNLTKILYPTIGPNFSEWFDYVFTLEWDVSTSTGTYTFYFNGVLNGTGALTANEEPGFVNVAYTPMLTLYGSCHSYETYDLYVSNEYCWTLQDAQDFTSKLTISPSKYTLWWKLQNNKPVGNLKDIDQKNGMPMYIPGENPNVAWVSHPDYAPAPYEPYTVIPTSALQPGTTLITATHANGETDSYTLTVAEPLTSEQDFAQLMIYADRDGTAAIMMDNPIINFPASVAVNEGKNQVAGEIIGSGTCNVTVTLNGVTDTTQFTIDAIPLNLNIGPETTLDYEGLPITFKMIASCDHFDKTVNLSTTGVGITVPPTIYLNGAPVEFEVTIDGFGEYSVTGEVDGETSTADIHSINDAIKLYLEADKDIFTEDLPITFNMRVYCSRDGLVTLSSTGADVVIPDTVNVVLGVAEFPVTIGSTGLKIISAVYDVAYAECAIDVDSEAVVISLGEDRHVYYRGNDIVITKTVYCNKEGAVNLTQSGTPVDMPATVTIVGGLAEFDITVSSGGDTMIEAEKDGVTTECRIISTAVPVESSIGPDQELFIRYQETLIPKLMVSTDRPVVVPITSTAGFPASVTVDGSEEITGSITVDGTYDVTTPYDSATIIVTKEPNVVRIGPNSENEPTLHVSTNWPGVVTLTVVPDYGYTLPATVTVGTTLEADIEGTFVVHGTYVVTATFGAATDTCTAVYSNEDSEGCYIYGTLTDAAGRPVRNATLTFKPIPTAQTIGSTILARTTKTARTDRLGAFEIRVLRGSILIVTCDILQYRKQITVPDQERVDLEDL